MKLNSKITALLFWACSSAAVVAQSTWYFGNAAYIKFGTTGPAPIAVINTPEGCSGIADTHSNVVMYTDGITVYNGDATSQVTGLPGNSSSTQNSVIVPLPDSCNKYFVFTVDAAENSYLSGLNATLIDVYPSSGPVIDYPIATDPLSPTRRLTPSNVLISEKIAVTKDGTGGYWVLVHGVSAFDTLNVPLPGYDVSAEMKFYAYHVTSSTPNCYAVWTTQTISTFTPGPHQSKYHIPSGGVDLNPGFAFNGQGQMKFSPAGTQVACVLPWTKDIQLYTFNLSTGLLSNQLLVPAKTGESTQVGPYYGVEYSPDGSKLYVAANGYRHYNSAGVLQVDRPISRLYQYSLGVYSAAAINSSQIQIATYNSYTGSTHDNYRTYGALQRGPDNKIYMARYNSNFLDVINSPNVAGTSCGYAALSKNINGTCKLGLPFVLIKDVDCSNGGSRMAATSTPVGGIAAVSNNLSIFPNPNNGSFTIDIVQPGAGTIEVFNMSGEKVKSAELSPSQSKIEMDLSAYKKGVYMVNVTVNGQKLSKRIITQ